ncbi:MAG TPA: NADH-ubiquinone oxidoreductase-F iron-sulfur binding region domain-containing protein [Gaiellaceae bacterium]|nr:NADH-ubiquinone oxidoreductase-F iron-sulfur binding region domain-containing protein [Gaiellaceae bacterium]
MSALATDHSASPLGTRRLLPAGSSRDSSWRRHVERYGPLPVLDRRRSGLVDQVELSGLTGRGGAAFPTAVKLRTVASGRSPVVVANGTEGEPASSKDEVLMTYNPHLVIDGVEAALAAVGSETAAIAVGRGADAARAALHNALAERRVPVDRIEVVAVPDRFVAGEESALVHFLNGGEAKPTFTPPRPFQKGVGGRPTLVQNVETLANLALIARYGGHWFRDAGTPDEPGTVLVTVLGGVEKPGVVEAELGIPVRELFDRCGGLTGPARAVLVGGYFGGWVPAELERPLTSAALGSLGARAIAVLPNGVCGLAETARVVRYLAGESAGQCGPCIFGLPAVADALERLAAGKDARRSLDRLPRLAAQIARRGACAHPDGALRFVDSALRVFGPEIEGHLAGRCSASHGARLLPTDTLTKDWK